MLTLLFAGEVVQWLEHTILRLIGRAEFVSVGHTEDLSKI